MADTLGSLYLHMYEDWIGITGNMPHRLLTIVRKTYIYHSVSGTVYGVHNSE